MFLINRIVLNVSTVLKQLTVFDWLKTIFYHQDGARTQSQMGIGILFGLESKVIFHVFVIVFFKIKEKY